MPKLMAMDDLLKRIREIDALWTKFGLYLEDEVRSYCETLERILGIRDYPEIAPPEPYVARCYTNNDDYLQDLEMTFPHESVYDYCLNDVATTKKCIVYSAENRKNYSLYNEKNL